MNDEAVYRTAPATPGLLKMCMALNVIISQDVNFIHDLKIEI